MVEMHLHSCVVYLAHCFSEAYFCCLPYHAHCPLSTSPSPTSTPLSLCYSEDVNEAESQWSEQQVQEVEVQQLKVSLSPIERQEEDLQVLRDRDLQGNATAPHQEEVSHSQPCEACALGLPV